MKDSFLAKKQKNKKCVALFCYAIAIRFLLVYHEFMKSPLNDSEIDNR